MSYEYFISLGCLRLGVAWFLAGETHKQYFVSSVKTRCHVVGKVTNIFKFLQPKLNKIGPNVLN